MLGSKLESSARAVSVLVLLRHLPRPIRSHSFLSLWFDFFFFFFGGFSYLPADFMMSFKKILILHPEHSFPPSPVPSLFPTPSTSHSFLFREGKASHGDHILSGIVVLCIENALNSFSDMTCCG